MERERVHVWGRSRESRKTAVWAFMQHCLLKDCQQQSKVWNELAQWQLNASPGCLLVTCINYDATFAKQDSNTDSIFSSRVIYSLNAVQLHPFLLPGERNVSQQYLNARFFPPLQLHHVLHPPTRTQTEKVSTHGRQTKVSLSIGQEVFPLLMS